MAKDKTGQQGTLDGVVVIEESPADLVRVEKSLHSVGFFASTANKEISRSVVQVIRRPDGQRIHAKAVIEGIPSLGLPTTADRDKYMAFMKIALDQRDDQGQLANPVRFAGADLIKLLRLCKGGFHYDEINDWCKRMVATTILSESSIFLADRRQYASDTFHVFDRVVLFGEELNDGRRADYYEVFLSHWQLTNFNQGYLLPLDFNAYLRLHRDIAKALFGHLSIWFYASKGMPVEKKYQDLCQLLHIRAYPHLSKARAVLQPSMEELVHIGYLSSWDLIRTTRGSDFKLVLSPGNRLLSLPNFHAVVNPEARAALEASLPKWVPELVARGVTERKARQLALDIPDTQPVFKQLEYVDHLIRSDQRGKWHNPAGLYIWAIENNIGVPQHFDSAAGGSARASADADSYTARLEYDCYCDQQVSAKQEELYPGERSEETLGAKLKQIRREQPDLFGRLSTIGRRNLAESMLRAEVREGLSLPGFEQWQKLNPQRSIF
ncbi:MAG: replication initiator protein A [Paludibaculum sp.]